ncbi:hypothetical protein VTO42DRAFT_4741 [Malbranchea cinnamomea]
MTTLSTAQLTSGFIDPSKPAEYPILLGDRLAGKQSAKNTHFVNVNYNYKTKNASPQQRAVITRGGTEGLYDLTIQDKAGNAEQTTLTYKYQGSVDPSMPAAESEYSSLVLVFDPKRKAFILEPVSTTLNFNLRSAPGKTDQQVAQQYPKLKTLLDEAGSGKADEDDGEKDDPGPADESNPFDYRHFLPNKEPEVEKSAEKLPSITRSERNNAPAKSATSHLIPSTATGPQTKPKPSPRPKAPQTNPLRQQKRTPKPSSVKVSPSSAKSDRPKSPPHAVPQSALSKSLPQEEDSKPEPAAPSPNIIVDGDLIIDMGSPPPPKRRFNINPRHFPSNNTSGNEAGYASDDDDDLEDPQHPAVINRSRFSRHRQEEEESNEDEEDGVEAEEGEDDEAADEEADEQIQAEDDDPLTAELKAAYERSLENERETMQRQIHQHHVVSEEESEESEEE